MKEYAKVHYGNVNANNNERNNKWNKIKWNIYHKEIEKDFPFKKIKIINKKVLLSLAKEYNLFIISSGHNKHILDFLKNNNIIKIFKKCLFFEDARRKTDKIKMLEEEFNISKKDTIFITDTIGDIIEARMVGYKSIGITTGHHDRRLLETENPVIIVDSLLEFSDLVKKIII